MESDLGQTDSGTEHKLSPHLGVGEHMLLVALKRQSGSLG